MVKNEKYDLDGNPKMGGDMINKIYRRLAKKSKGKSHLFKHPPPAITTKNTSPSGHRRRRKALIFEHPPPL
tara:strand:+ start:98 stop:310 length:213 start_codon:yes stop_codon:yes gene_type:complete